MIKVAQSCSYETVGAFTYLTCLPLLQAKYINVDGDGTVPAESAKVIYVHVCFSEHLPFALELIRIEFWN